MKISNNLKLKFTLLNLHNLLFQLKVHSKLCHKDKQDDIIKKPFLPRKRVKMNWYKKWIYVIKILKVLQLNQVHLNSLITKEKFICLLLIHSRNSPMQKWNLINQLKVVFTKILQSKKGDLVHCKLNSYSTLKYGIKLLMFLKHQVLLIKR